MFNIDEFKTNFINYYKSYDKNEYDISLIFDDFIEEKKEVLKKSTDNEIKKEIDKLTHEINNEIKTTGNEKKSMELIDKFYEETKHIIKIKPDACHENSLNQRCPWRLALV